MPSAPIIFDGSWHRLLLTASTISGRDFRTLGSTLPKELRLRPTSFSAKPRLRYYTNIVGREPDPKWSKAISRKEPRPQKQLFNQIELREQDRVRRLDLGSAYKILRCAALGNQHSQVQVFVQTLVQERGERPNLRLYDALLLANADCDRGSAAEVARLLEELANEGLTPDSTTYHAALKALAIHPDYLLRNHILEELRKRWFSLTKDGWHSLVAGQIRDRQYESAILSLEGMRWQGVRIEPWLYDVLVYTLCAAEEFDSAIKLMEYRLSDGEQNVSGTLWYHLLDVASRALHLPATLFAYRARVESDYLNLPAGICINVLSTAARHGDTYLATSVLRVLGRRSGYPIQLHHYEALLETYVVAKDLCTALTLLATMKASGCPPSEASARPVYMYLCQSPSLPAKALSILKDFRNQDRQVPIQAVNAVMQAQVTHNDLESALEIYKSLHTVSPHLSPDTATYNILFRGCVKNGRKDLAMFLASEMVALKVRPDTLTYDRLILVCLSSETSTEDAWRYFEEMHGLGWWPRDGTVVALVRRACEAGEEWVWGLVERMKQRVALGTRVRALIIEHWKGGAEEAANKLEGDGMNHVEVGG